MTRLLGLVAIGSLMVILCGCGPKDPDPNGSETHAPPPGPNADLNPPSIKDKKIPAPPSMGAPGAPSSPGPAPAPGH